MHPTRNSAALKFKGSSGRVMPGVGCLSGMADDLTIPERRKLSLDERKLIEWLLTNGTTEARSFASQLPLLTVVSRCTCGCPSVDLAIGERESRTVGASTILADAIGHSPDGSAVGVILHARQGEISELEVYSQDGEAKIFSLPKPEMLEAI